MSRLVMSFFFCCATLIALVRAQETAPPKALPCSLPAPTASTPAVKVGQASSSSPAAAGVPSAGWTATGGNEASKLSDMAALSFESWLKGGAEGAASADAAAAACDSKNVAKYTIDVKSACKKVDDAASASEAGGGLQYALEYTVSYGCRARAKSTSSAKKSSSSEAVEPAAASPPAAAAGINVAVPPLGAVKIEATLRTFVAQPPLRESSDGSLVRPRPSVEDVWFVQGTAETSKVVERTVKKSIGGGGAGKNSSSLATAAAGGAPSPWILSTEEREVAPVGSALASAFGGSGSSSSSGASSSSSISQAISSVGAALASALDAAAGADARLGDALDAAAEDYRDSYYGGSPHGGGGAVIITSASPLLSSSPSGFDVNDFSGDDESAAFGASDHHNSIVNNNNNNYSSSNDNDDDDKSDFDRPVAATMKMMMPSSSSSSSPSSVLSHGAGSESAAEEGKRAAREAAASAANPLAAAKPE